jgi:hypothetical protein
MDSTRQAPQLLEPSNLLEPLDLTERQLDFAYPLTRPRKEENSRRGFARTTPGAPVLRASESQRRSPLKSVLMVAGALACFGAGTVLPQLHSFMRGDLGPESTVGSADQPSSPIAQAATKSDETSPVKPKSTEQTSAEPMSAAARSNDSPASHALNGTAAAPEASSAEGGGSAVAQPAPPAQPASAAQQACPKGDANCLEGGALSAAKELTTSGSRAANPGDVQPVRRTKEVATTDGSAANPAANAQPARRTATPQPANPEPPETRASARQDERTSHRSKRAVQQEKGQVVAKRNAAAGTRWSRVEDRSVEWGKDSPDDSIPTVNSSGRWQKRDGYQNGWRDQNTWADRSSDDDVPVARFSRRGENRDLDQGSNRRRDRTDGRWQERDTDRASNGWRDRYDDYGRDGDRRFRAAREDDFQMGRAERREGPLMMFPPARYRW